MVSWTNIFSGKFIFTVVTAIVFAYACYSKVLNGEQIYGVIMLVVAFYFNKQDQGGKNGSNGDSYNVVNGSLSSTGSTDSKS